MNKASGDVWEQGWTEKQPLFKAFAQMEILSKCRNIVGITRGRYFVYAEQGMVHAFLSKNTYQLIQESGKKMLDSRIATQCIHDIQNTIKSFWTSVRILRAQVESENLHHISFIKQFKEFDVLILKIFAYFRATWEATTLSLEEQLKQLLNVAIPDAWEEALILSVTPTESDLLLKEKLSWLEVLAEPTTTRIQDHMLLYPYHFCNMDSDEAAVSIIKERIRKQSIPQVKAEVEKSQNDLEKRKAQQYQLFRKINSPDVEKIAHILQQFALLRLELKNCWAGVHYSLFPLFQRISEAVGQSINDVMMFWSMKDILTFLEKNAAVSKEEIRMRNVFYVLLFDNDVLSFYVGDEAKARKREILKGYAEQKVTSFQGSVACRGEATGIVKIVLFEDLRIIEKTALDITDKTILVTGMTNPNMIPIIKKVKAIVTDEGGITCHAAIISREFNIPCIVGTKIATQVLKDGDIVEVNAYDGIVRIVQ